MHAPRSSHLLTHLAPFQRATTDDLGFLSFDKATQFATVAWWLTGEAKLLLQTRPPCKSKLLQLTWWSEPWRPHQTIMKNCNLWLHSQSNPKPQRRDFNQELNCYKNLTFKKLFCNINHARENFKPTKSCFHLVLKKKVEIQISSAVWK